MRYNIIKNYKSEEAFAKKGFNSEKIEVYNDNDEVVAFMEYSYISNIDFILKYSNILSYLSDFRKLHIDENKSKKEQLKYLFNYFDFDSFDFSSVTTTDKKEAINDMYNIVTKDLRSKFSDEVRNSRIEYGDKAVVDFVLIHNEKTSPDGLNYRKNGILEKMYILAFESLKEKDITLHSSISQSKEGKTIWDKLKKSGFEIVDSGNSDRKFIKSINEKSSLKRKFK